MAAEEGTSSANEASDSTASRSAMVSLVISNFVDSIAVSSQTCLMLCAYGKCVEFCCHEQNWPSH